jgi:flagellar hook assembly protein FlgD
MSHLWSPTTIEVLSTKIIVAVYNLLGQKVVNLWRGNQRTASILVVTLVDEKQNAGIHAVKWDGKNRAGLAVSSGVYIYRIATNNSAAIRKMLLIR